MTKSRANATLGNDETAVRPTTPTEGSEPTQPTPFRPGSKLALLVEQLQQGATLEELMTATGWQAHSVRGAMAGALKTRGLTVTSARIDGRGRVYHLSAADALVSAAPVTGGSVMDGPVMDGPAA